MEREPNKQTVPASELNTRTIVERKSMPNHQLVRADQPPVEGKLVFHPVIKEEGQWKLRKTEVLIDPEKPMVIVGEL